MKLKTLKDCCNCLSGDCDSDFIRQEAIKWLKRTKGRAFYLIDANDWIEFFNLTEEI